MQAAGRVDRPVVAVQVQGVRVDLLGPDRGEDDLDVKEARAVPAKVIWLPRWSPGGRFGVPSFSNGTKSLEFRAVTL